MDRIWMLTVFGAVLAVAGSAAGGPPEDVRAALAEVVRPIAGRLADPELAVRQEAARELGRLAPAAAPAAGELLRAMKEAAVQPAAVEARSL